MDSQSRPWNAGAGSPMPIALHRTPTESTARRWSASHPGSLAGPPSPAPRGRNYAAQELQLKQLKEETGALKALTDLAEERSKEMIKQKDDAMNDPNGRGRRSTSTRRRAFVGALTRSRERRFTSLHV